MTASIEIVRDADYWTFTPNRPDKMNALSPAAAEALLAWGDEARQSGARTPVFAGNGRNFSAGFDQGNLEQESDADRLHGGLANARGEKMLDQFLTRRDLCYCEEAVRIGFVMRLAEAESASDAIATVRDIARLLDRETQQHL